MHFPSRFHAVRLTVFALAAATGLSASAASYTLVDLGPSRLPVAVNDHGEVAASRQTPTFSYPVLWRDGRWHRLQKAPSHSAALNDHGDVAGDNGAHPMLWASGRKPRQLALTPDAIFGLARGINDAQTVVGMMETNDGSIHCFQWTRPQGAIDLGFMGDGNYCQAYGVNGAGQVTGEVSPTAERAAHAFVFDRGVFHDLGILANGSTSRGMAINGHGEVAGIASVPPLDDLHFHAVKWRADGRLVDLDPDGKYTSSCATGIADDGEVVGWVQLDEAGHEAAVRFDGQHAVRLETEVRNGAGWTLQEADAVNGHGEIVGVGKAPDGREHAFLLRPE
jgi:probable HAF family extracellular repeat protein